MVNPNLSIKIETYNDSISWKQIFNPIIWIKKVIVIFNKISLCYINYNFKIFVFYLDENESDYSQIHSITDMFKGKNDS